MPIVAFTGGTGVSLRRELMAAGASTVVYKPLLPEAVLNCIEDCRL